MVEMEMKDHGPETWEEALELLSRVNTRLVEEELFLVHHPADLFQIMRRGHKRMADDCRKFFRKLPVVPLDVFRKI